MPEQICNVFNIGAPYHSKLTSVILLLEGLMSKKLVGPNISDIEKRWDAYGRKILTVEKSELG